MFFIVNHENSIIAADADFLEGIGADSIYEAALLIKKGEVTLDELEQSISYFQQSKAFTKVKLSTFLGDAYLYEINEEEEETEPIQEEQEEELFNLAMPQETSLENIMKEAEPETAIDDEEIFSLSEENMEPEAPEPLEEEPLAFSEPEENIDTLLKTETPDIPVFDLADTEEPGITTEENLPDTSEELLGLLETESDTPDIKEEVESTEESLTIDFMRDDDEPPLSMKTVKEEALEEEISAFSTTDDALDISLPEPGIVTGEEAETIEGPADEPEESRKEYSTNFREIAELIGVSEEEYMHFLDDFAKESSQLEPNLRSHDLRESREALSILKEASLLLHLPHITEKLNTLSDATSDEKSSIIDSYLSMVAQISNSTETQVSAYETPAVTLSDEPAEEKVSFTDESTDEAQEEPVMAESVKNLIEQSTFSLDQVQAVPFDFSINEAADELTLPASLVSEFVVDFINQAKENLPVLQKAYEQKDMETIQTTAHMLKGASSNLRIVPIADTLYKLQFNEDLAQVPELITLFSGQLKALTIQMDQV